MPDWMRWQIEGIVWLQRLQPPWAIAFWRGVSFLGEEQAFLLLLPALLWCYRKREVLYTATALLLGSYLTFVLKDLFAMPRPFHVAPDQVRILLPGGEALGYGLPSGHALNAAAMWGALAGMVRRPLFTAFAIGLIFLIGFSRVVLGVHFLHDVLAGWAVGALVAVATVRLFPPLAWRVGRAPRTAALLALGGVLLLFLLHGTPETAVPLGAWLGMAWGALGEARREPFDPGGPWGGRAARLVLGLATLAAIYLALSAAFARLPGGPLVALPLRFARYALIGLWITWGAPWLFLRLGLARPQRPMQVLPADPGPGDL